MMEMPDLTPDILLRAYSIGVFPMAENRGPELVWVDPRMRGIIPMNKFHVPRRLRRTVRNDTFEVTFDRVFNVIKVARKPRMDVPARGLIAASSTYTHPCTSKVTAIVSNVGRMAIWSAVCMVFR